MDKLRLVYISDELHELYKNKGMKSQSFIKSHIKSIIEKYPNRCKAKPDSFKKQITVYNIDCDDMKKIKNIANSFGIPVSKLIHYELFSDGESD